MAPEIAGQEKPGFTMLRLAIGVYVVWVAVLLALVFTSSEKPPVTNPPVNGS